MMIKAVPSPSPEVAQRHGARLGAPQEPIDTNKEEQRQGQMMSRVGAFVGP